MSSKENRADAYASSKNDGMASMENLSEKLQADLRKHIQNLGMFPVLSKKWWDMSKSLKRIGSITVMEEKIEKKDKDATLWECEEVALRFLLEDGKLNLCLRLLVDVKSFQYDLIKYDTEIDENDQRELVIFEESVGQIMRNAWKHVEAIQTTDLPLLIQHVTKVMKKAAEFPQLVTDAPKKDRCKRQETLVMYYFQDLLTQMTAEAVKEHRVMPELIKGETTTHLIAHLTNNHGNFRPADMVTGSNALSLIIDSEDYSIPESKTKHIPVDKRKDVIALQEAYLEDLLKDDRDRKRLLRPLTDEIQKFQNMAGK